MASQEATGQYVPKGVNNESLLLIKVTLSSAMTSSQTLDVTLPEAIDNNYVPVFAVAYTQATPAVGAGANPVITSHNKTTGVTRITAGSGGIADGSQVLIGYAPIG